MASTNRKENAHEALDILAARFRQRSMPTAIMKVLQTEFAHILNTMAPNTTDTPLALKYRIILVYCGDQASVKQLWEIARTSRKGVEPKSRGDWEQLRMSAVEAILYRRIQGSTRLLVASLLAETDAESSLAFRGKVLDALDDLDEPEVAAVVLKAYDNLPPPLKPRAVELLTRRPGWTRALLTAVTEKRIPAGALNVTQLRNLQDSRDPEVSAQVKAIWGTIRERRNPQRERVVEQIRRSLRQMTGDPAAGQAVFGKLCAQCHKIYGAGQDVGPDITSNGRNDFNQLLSNVFDPSLVIGPGYQATTLATKDGRLLTGLVAEDGKDRIVLKLQGGKLESIPRDQVNQMKTADVSLMPEEVEKQLSPQEIADLFAFLCLDRPPSDPAAKPLPGSGPIKHWP